MQNELRKSYDTDSWSLISPLTPSSVGCALCPGNEENTEETFSLTDKESKTGKWLSRSIVDPYPLTHPMSFKLNESDPLLQSFKAHGWSEVIIETRDHKKELHDLNAEEIKSVLDIYSERLSELSKRENVEQIGITKDNLRTEFKHSYSKIFTLPMLTNKMKEKVRSFADFQYKHEECIYCNLIKKEKNSPRFISENDHFICLAPFSQEITHEMWILPKKHVGSLEELNDFEKFSLAELLKTMLIRFSVGVQPFQYVMSFQIKPIKEKDFHFHMVIGQKGLHSSLEEGFNLYMHKMSPEDTAKIFRGKK